MPAMRKTPRVVWLRRTVQGASLALFFYLFLATAETDLDRPGRGVKLFFELDPLAALSSWIAAHALESGMLLALATLAVTAVFGRWFCGWICPLGTLHHAVASLRGKSEKAAGAYSRWQRAKYFALIGVVCAAALGASLAGWLDPISFLFRSLATAVFPAFAGMAARLFGWAYNSDPGLGPVRLTALTEPVYALLRAHVLPAHPAQYYGNVLIGWLFLAALALNLYRARFWCRYICPLGAMLGVAAQKAVVRLRRDASRCNDCRACAAECQGGADPHSGAWRAAECMYCFNCKSECSGGAIVFAIGSAPEGEKPVPPLGLGRRQVLASGAAGLSVAMLFRTAPLAHGRSFNPALVRPPGARAEDELLSRCVRCGECMKVCPTNAIHPAAMEAGLEGVWTPVLKMNIGYCEYECTLCSQVCPTGAIRKVAPQEKQKLKIGLAFIDRGRCLPYALAKPCIVCEEHCPTPKKAIWLDEVRAPAGGGQWATVQQPHVDAELCVGCGICVTKCPVKDRAAIQVTSAGETRNAGNRVTL
jgi:polyferredoxin